MNIFKILDSERVEDLTLKIYERATKRKEPYYQTSNGKPKHYAVCPACSNPIQIINLYIESNIDRKKDKQPLYAKHIPFDVNGIANYNQDEYDSCPLSNPSTITPGVKRPSGSNITQDIINIIKGHSSVLYDFVCQISGIQITENLFKIMVENFYKEQGYMYKGVTKFNLPYAFLYMTDNTNILYQPLRNNPLGKLISESIGKKCSNVKVNNNFIITIDKTKRMRLEMYFSNHKISSNGEYIETMDLIISENINGTIREILVHKIDFDQKTFFTNTINKNKRLKKIVDDIL